MKRGDGDGDGDGDGNFTNYADDNSKRTKESSLLILHRHRPQTIIKLVLQEGSPVVHIFINIVYGCSCVFLAWQALLVTMVKKLR